MNTSPWRTHTAATWSSFAGRMEDSHALRRTPTRCSTDPARPPRRSQIAPDALPVPSPTAKVAAAGSALECTDERSSACRAVSQPELPHPVRTAPRRAVLRFGYWDRLLADPPPGHLARGRL